jgi:hypothetical protein
MGSLNEKMRRFFFYNKEKKKDLICREKLKWNGSLYDSIEEEIQNEIKLYNLKLFNDRNDRIAIWKGKMLIEIEVDLEYSNDWIYSVNFFNYVYENDSKFYYTNKEELVKMVKIFTNQNCYY